jgi:hypothetical protein
MPGSDSFCGNAASRRLGDFFFNCKREEGNEIASVLTLGNLGKLYEVFTVFQLWEGGPSIFT